MRVLFLFGEICSGKSTFDAGQGSIRITVSNIVKRLMQSEDREILQKSKHLDTIIADEIIEEISNIYAYFAPLPQYLIVDGIRQYSIVEQVQKWVTANTKIPVEYKWLEVDSAERKRRFEARKDPKDTLTFEEAEKRDNELGLSQLFSILKEQNKI